MPQHVPNYFEWIYEDVPGAASMGPLIVEFVVLDAINRGRPISADFPDDAAFQMDPNRPQNVMLIDNVYNAETFPLVSPVVRDFLLQENILQLELLPVRILDHRGRRAAEDYTIVHPCRIVDCIDQQRSVFEWNQLDPTAMAPVTSMILDPEKLGADDILIRPRYVEHLVLVREDLAEQLIAQNFRGLYMGQPNE